MACRRITVQEYQDLIAANPNVKSYPNETDCQEKTCCDAGCCRESVRVGKCGGASSSQNCTPADFGMSNEWISNGGSRFYCDFVRQRPKINGACNQADFPPLVTCSQHAQKCVPLDPCQTICIYGDVCPDPNDPTSCYQDCVRFETICENCFEYCASFDGADFGPCIPPYQEDTTITYEYYIENRSIYNGSGCCPNGECPSWTGECV